MNFYFCAEKTTWMEDIMDEISAETSLKQISVFTFNRLSHDKDDDLILLTITERFTTILINLEKISSFDDKNKFISTYFRNPRQYSWIVIDLRSNGNKPNIQKVKDVFEFVSLNTAVPKPKMLVISADQTNWNIDEFKNILLFAWHNKYLDFSIVGKDPYGNLKILNYNPFTKTHFIGNLDLNTKLFPDKMRDMHGYPLRFPVMNYFPLLRLKNSSNLEVKELADGLYYYYLKLICKMRNCTLNPVIKNYSNIVDEIAERLNENNFHMFPVEFYRGDQFYSKKPLMGKNYAYAKLIFVVPVRQGSKFNALIFLYSFLTFIGFIILFLLLSRMCKLSKKFWYFLNIYKILLGHKTRIYPA